METTKNLVWVPDKTEVFKKGYVVEPVGDDKVKVRFDDGSVSVFAIFPSSRYDLMRLY